jgi:adenylosuccinate lyase
MANEFLDICHLDGRNFSKVEALSRFFSEWALNKYRLLIEIKYLQVLASQKVTRKLTLREKKILEKIPEDFSLQEMKKYKKIENEVNHDVKAIELYIKERLKKTSLADLMPMIHFCLCSEDINNLAFGLMIKDSLNEVLFPRLKEMIKNLRQLAQENKDLMMVGRTHGQPAAPTFLGKEIFNFVARLEKEAKSLENLKIEGKLTGSVGNFNSFLLVMPEKNWSYFSQNFVASLGLKPNLTTTQILPYDSYLRVFDNLKRINNILLGFVQDMWLYIAYDYFSLKIIKEEVGSSSMPQKVNPIDFEAAEGNLGFCNSFYEYFVRKLSVSRWQRDLSDSTVRRNFGLAFAYNLFAWDSIFRGLSRVKANRKKIKEDLESHYELLMEAVQNLLRKRGLEKAYEMVKDLSRGKQMEKKDFLAFIEALPVNKKIKDELRGLEFGDFGGLRKW